MLKKLLLTLVLFTGIAFSQASPVSGGSTSSVTTKGDLQGYNTAAARVAVGTDGQCLKADSSNPLGVAYSACSGAATGYQTLQNATSGITQRTVLNWLHSITCVDNAGSTRSDCDITDKSGTGTTVVMTGSPTIVTPTIASFINATHNHTNAAGGGTLTLAGAAFANQGTTTTLLHGNAAGNPSFGAVALGADVSGTLPIGNGGTGQTTNTKGDILAANGSLWNKLGVGSDGQVLTADAASTNGIKWATAGSGSSPLTTKGDLFGHSTVDARIPVGTDGNCLVADSTQALGLKWASCGGGSSLFTSFQVDVNTAITGTGAYFQLATSGSLSSAWSGSGTSGSPYIATISVSDASAVAKGVLALTGDLGNTPTSPQVVATHLASALPVNQGGTGTASTLTGLVRGGSSVMTASELSGDVTTSGSNATTVVATHLSSALPLAQGGTGQTTNTKGDILAANGSLWNKLGVGSDGQVLTADAASTNGIKWAAGSSGMTPFVQLAAVGTGANTTETALCTVSFTPGQIASGNAVKITIQGFAGAGGSDAIDLYWKDNTTLDGGATGISVNGTLVGSRSFTFEILVGMRDSTTAVMQAGYVDGANNGLTFPRATSAKLNTVSLSNTMTFILSGTNGTATTNDVEIDMCTAKPINF